MKRADLSQSSHKLTALIPNRLYSQDWDYVDLQFRQEISLSRAKGSPALTLKTVRVGTHHLSDMFPEVLGKHSCAYRDLVKMHSGLMSLGWGLRVCISNIYPGDAGAVGLWTTL